MAHHGEQHQLERSISAFDLNFDNMSMLEDGAIVSDLLREKGQNSARSRFISDESYFAAASSTHFIAPDKEMDESEESKEPPTRINTCGQAFYTAPADQLDIPHCDDIMLYSL